MGLMNRITQMVSGWQVRIATNQTSYYNDLWYWCSKNFGSVDDRWHHVASDCYWFQQESDAILFFLTWASE